MAVKIINLGSGSSGNSTLICDSEFGIMIDAGFSKKEILSRLEYLKISPHIIKALFITHNHSDHVKGARVFADYMDIPTYTTNDTRLYLESKHRIGLNRIVVDINKPIEVDNFIVTAFKVPHDAIDPVGYTVIHNDTKVGYAMDLGYLPSSVRQHLVDCNVLILESNYDSALLKNSGRPLKLTQRIAGNAGHLGNTSVYLALVDLVTRKTKHICLGHLSIACNTVDAVFRNVNEALRKLERTDISVQIFSQNTPSKVII